MNKKIFISAIAILATSACGEQIDFYSRVHDVCNMPVPDLGKIYDPETDSKTYLTPECKSALESVIPYDTESWKSAPEGRKDRVTEAFQAMIAYPLAIPAENKLFGVSNQFAGAIPGDLIDVFRREGNPNQSLFNYILNKTDTVKYDATTRHDNEAQYTFEPNITPRQVTVYDTFWDPTNIFQMLRQPFTMAATLAHEAYHASGQPHTICANDQNSGPNCDDTLKGPYGMTATYLHFLLMGSASCVGEGCKPMLNFWPIVVAGTEICSVVMKRLNHPIPELADLLKTVASVSKTGVVTQCNNITTNWTLKAEGLPPLSK